MPDINQEDKVTVEAETVEAALAEISTHFGEDAEIMRAQKVHRGGVGGFFAREMVQLTARRRREAAPVATKPETGHPTDGIADVLERMAQDADAADGDFRTVLRRELSSRPSDTGSQGFLAAVGWESETDDEPSSRDLSMPEPQPEPGLPADPADEHPVPSFTEASDDGVEGDDVPKPVAVGPVLKVAPVFPDTASDETVEVDESTVIEVEAVSDPAPMSGRVVPFEFQAEAGLDHPEDLELEPALTLVNPDLSSPPEADEPTAEVSPISEPPPAPPGMGRVDWSTTALLRLGMPAPVIEAVADLEPADDLGWIEGIADVVAPHCGPLPTDDVIVVGPHAERLAEPLGLPLVHAGDMAPYAGSFCAMVEDSVRDREWLEYVQGGRGIHLVIGDEPWQDLLIGEPVAVSWVGESAVSDALYLAFTLGATLGYGTVDGFVSSMVRAQPTDVAIAVRRIVGRQ